VPSQPRKQRVVLSRSVGFQSFEPGDERVRVPRGPLGSRGDAPSLALDEFVLEPRVCELALGVPARNWIRSEPNVVVGGQISMKRLAVRVDTGH
jgi:hypothetical protein